jgi:hypothetical protein
MTRGEAYKAYYAIHKEHILEANKERAKQRRENPEEAHKLRGMRQKREALRKASLHKVALEELSQRNKDHHYSLFYKKLSESSLLHHITPSIMSFLLRIHCEAMTAPQVDGNTEAKSNE